MTGSQRDLREFMGQGEEPSEPQMQELLTLYLERRGEIEARLAEFREIWRQGSDEDLFFEMAFCLCTPQSSALSCDKAVAELRERGLLTEGSREDITTVLDSYGVRFPENKARWIVEARKKFFSSPSSLRARLSERSHDPRGLRDWLQQEVLGLGMKEASHYVRNIGLGEDLAILDRHILNNLLRLGVIELIPKSLSKVRYLEIEERMREFCRRVGIPMGHMDLLLWARQTGFIFK
jgi:N-glycosylase/DNA lyase